MSAWSSLYRLWPLPAWSRLGRNRISVRLVLGRGCDSGGAGISIHHSDRCGMFYLCALYLGMALVLRAAFRASRLVIHDSSSDGGPHQRNTAWLLSRATC